MRLIDADKIDFNEVFVGASEFAQDTRNAAQMLIDNQPTAFDVDKIIEQLEKKESKARLQLMAEEHYDCESKSRPDWCPLMDLPEKDNGDYPANTFDAGHADGWNDCIDEITGGNSDD